MRTKPISTLILAARAARFMQGCNTMEGPGKDTETAGDELENAAKKNT